MFNLLDIPKMGGVILIAWSLHSWHVDRIKNRHIRELEAQATFLQDDCKKQQQITEGVSHDYQSKISSLNRELARHKRLYNKANGLRPANASGSGDGAAGSEIDAGSHGNDAGAFLDYAAEAEKYRIQLQSCQSFIEQTWALRD